MKNKKNNSKKVSKQKMVAVGAGVAVLGAGAYYLLGPKGKEHQKKVKALSAKMKKEVQREIKKAKKVSMPVYHKAIDVISENYVKQYKMHEKEIKDFAKKLKKDWKDIR